MEPLFPNEYYHIYNRGNNSENIFYQNENYQYFLQKYAFYLAPYLDTYAFCLMPNHFHLLVKIKEKVETEGNDDNLQGLPDLAGFQRNVDVSQRPARLEKPCRSVNVGKSIDEISQQFSNFFNSYTKSINKQQNRHGSLFEKPFKRKRIADENYLRRLVWYIHQNPIKHGFVDYIEDWQFSSYHLLLNDKPSRLKKTEVLEWFDGKENYCELHQEKMDLRGLDEVLLEG